MHEVLKKRLHALYLADGLSMLCSLFHSKQLLLEVVTQGKDLILICPEFPSLKDAVHAPTAQKALGG